MDKNDVFTIASKATFIGVVLLFTLIMFGVFQ